jgi:hypothetical protein
MDTDLIRDLRQLPDGVVGHLAAVVLSELPVLHLTLGQELRAAIETRAVRDWARVANSLRHYFARPGLAAEIEDAISDL